MGTGIVFAEEDSLRNPEAEAEGLIAFYPPWFPGPRFIAPELSAETREALAEERN